jgi:hypothetical protein
MLMNEWFRFGEFSEFRTDHRLIFVLFRFTVNLKTNTSLAKREKLVSTQNNDQTIEAANIQNELDRLKIHALGGTFIYVDVGSLSVYSFIQMLQS